MALQSSFFKIILDLQKLAIPNKFMEKYGEELSDDNIRLNIPTGAKWEVKLVRDQNNKAWLLKGWPEFVKFYSINYGHFLVFTYKGNFSFDVLIFDMSALEIKYPIFETKRKREANSSIPLPSSSKKAKVAVPDKVFGARFVLTRAEKTRVEDYQCKHPSFVVRLSTFHIQGYSYVNIPLAFVRKYLQNDVGEFIKLCRKNVTKKHWLVKVIKSSDSHVCFRKGWKDFRVDNELQVGDICVFELIKGAEKKFRVGVLPAAGDRLKKATRRVILEVD